MNTSKKILVIDDEPDAIEFVKAVLSEFGNIEVISALDGDEGLEKAIGELPDLIILDVMMPNMDGFKVFYELRKREGTKEIPVVMLTGVADKVGIRFFKKDMKNYLGYEPLEYIEKPMNPDKLKEVIGSVVKPSGDMIE